MLNYAYKSQPLPFPKLFHSQGNQAINLQCKQKNFGWFPCEWKHWTILNVPSIAKLSLFSGMVTGWYNKLIAKRSADMKKERLKNGNIFLSFSTCLDTFPSWLFKHSIKKNQNLLKNTSHWKIHISQKPINRFALQIN